MDGIIAQSRVVRGWVSQMALEELWILTGKEKQHGRTDWALQAGSKGEGQPEQRLPRHLIKLFLDVFVMLLFHHHRWNIRHYGTWFHHTTETRKNKWCYPNVFYPLYHFKRSFTDNKAVVYLLRGQSEKESQNRRSWSLQLASADRYPRPTTCALYTTAYMHKADIWEDVLYEVILAIDSPFFFTWHFTSGWSMISQTATQLSTEPNALRCQPSPCGL